MRKPMEARPLLYRQPDLHSVAEVEPEPATPVKNRLYLGWIINERGNPEQTRRWMLNSRWIKPLTVVGRDSPILVGDGFELDLESGSLTRLHQGDDAKIIPSTHTVYGDLMSLSLKSGDHFVLYKQQSVVLWCDKANIAESLAEALHNGEYDPLEHVAVSFETREGRYGNYTFEKHDSFIDVFYSTCYLGSVKEALSGAGGIRGYKNPGAYDPSSAVRICTALKRAEYNPLTGVSRKFVAQGKWDRDREYTEAWLAKIDKAINAR